MSVRWSVRSSIHASVGWSESFLKKYQRVTKTYLLSDSSEISDIIDINNSSNSSESSVSSDSSESFDSSDSCDLTNFVTIFLTWIFCGQKNCNNLKTQILIKLKNSNCDKTWKLIENIKNQHRTNGKQTLNNKEKLNWTMKIPHTGYKAYLDRCG